MAYRERQKISQMTPKGADLSTTDLVEVSVLESGSYVTKSVTGLQIINAASGGALDLQAVTDNGNITTNNIEIQDSSLFVTNTIDQTTLAEYNRVITENETNQTRASINNDGSLMLQAGAEQSTLKNTNVTNTGVNLEFPNKATGSYTIATTSDLTSGYIPYTGATQNADLGEYELKAGQLSLDVSPTGTAAVGTTRWNNNIGSSETTLKGGSVILKNGVDLVARVVNKVVPNATLTKANYTAVKVSGAQGQRLAVDYAKADIDLNSADTIGLVTETIATNQEGFIITVGQIEDINTTGSLQGETWSDGDVLYLSPTTAGALTNIKPTGATGHIVVIGYVEYAHAVHGKIYVKIMNGWELDELHNVYINTGTLANNDALIYESSTQLWKNKTIATALGYTPVTNARTISTNAPLSGGGDLTVNRTLSISQATTSTDGYLSSTDWNTFNGKQSALVSGTNIKTINSNSLLGSGNISVGTVTSVTGTAPIASSGGTTPAISISQATTSTDGYLSSTDWTTFNNKASYTPRVQSVTSSATVTPVNTNDLVKITAQAAGLTLANPTGSWDEGQSLMIRIKDNGTARAITYDTNYRAIGVTLPTTTTANKTTYLGIIYNSTDTKWDVIGVTTQA